MRALITGACALTVAATFSCGGGDPTILREATKEDLQHLVLQKGDGGPSLEWVDYGLSGGSLPDGRTSTPFIYQVGFERTNDQDDVICVNDDAQLSWHAEAALNEWRDSFSSESSKVKVDVLNLRGLPTGSFAYHRADSEPLCGPGRIRTAHAYTVMMHRSNVLAFIALWSESTDGEEKLVSLAKIQAERMETALAE